MRYFIKTLLSSLSFLYLITSFTPTIADDYTESEFQNLRYQEASFYGQRADQRGVEIGIVKFEKNEQRRILGKKVLLTKLN